MCQEDRQPRPPARLRYFNEFYLLNKSISIVMEKNKHALVLVSTLSQPKDCPQIMVIGAHCEERTQRPSWSKGRGLSPGTAPGEGGSGCRWAPHSLNFHSCRHMGQCCCTCCALSHLRMQCMWKQCEHWPHTSGQSSPGTLQSGQQPLNAILQIPQFSSLATQSQVATPFQHLIFTFMAAKPAGRGERTPGWSYSARRQRLGARSAAGGRLGAATQEDARPRRGKRPPGTRARRPALLAWAAVRPAPAKGRAGSH